MKRCWGALTLLLCISGVQAEHFGLQMTPRWGERGELTVTLVNYSKLAIETRALSVQFGAADERACRWRESGAITLGPVETKVLTVASARGVARCLARLPNTRGIETSALRFGVRGSAVGEQSEPVRVVAEVRRNRVRDTASANLALVRTGGAP